MPNERLHLELTVYVAAKSKTLTSLFTSVSAVARCTCIVVDTRAGALAEAGDLVQPLSRGVITPDRIAGDLAELLRGDCAGRTQCDQLTLFKSVGTALEDLAAAQLVVGR